MTANTAYSGFFGTIGPDSPDGASDAASGPAQHPTALSIYPYRPLWNVSGVDYRTGLDDDAVLTDWVDAVIPGAVKTAHEVRVTGQTDLVIELIDFSTHGGAALSLVTCVGTIVRQNKFGGTSYATLPAGIINADPLCSDLTIIHNEVNGGQGGSSSSVVQLSQVGGTITVEYNWFAYFSQHALSLVCRTGELVTVIERFNLFEQGAWTPGAHLNCLEWNGTGTLISILCAYNTMIQTFAIPAGGEVFQGYQNGSGNFDSPEFTNNTIIARSVSYGAHIEVSYGYHLAGFVGGTTVSGTPVFENNYADQSAAYGIIYPGGTESTPPFVPLNIIDMISGGDLEDPYSAAGSLQVLHIAPVVEGGVTVVTGRVSNNASPFTFSILDGDLVDYLWTEAWSTGGLGTAATGYFAFAITTPGIGDHTISVHGSDGVLDYQVPFTVTPADSPSITVDTPAAAVEGEPQTISGAWANMDEPIGFQYQVDGVGFPQSVSDITVGIGTWSFDISAPPAIMFANNDVYVPHTLTVTAFPANVSATTEIFTNIPETTLTVIPVPNSVPHNSTLLINGQFGGTLITGLKYAFDADSLVDVLSPTIGDGTWEFTVPAPVDGVDHTVTVKGVGANTEQDTSPPFYTSEEIFAPGAPGEPTPFLVTPGFIASSWTAPVTGSPVDTYEFQWSLHGDDSWSTPSGGDALTVLKFVLNGLSAATDYDLRVNGTNLGGTGPYGTNSTGVTTLATYDDGAGGAPAGVSPQLPTLLDGYPSRPSWNVAGVDYGVGPPAATSYTAWDVYTGAGISHGADFIRIEAVDDVVLDGIDFSASGGAYLNVINCQRLKVTNSIWGNTSSSWVALVATDTLSGDLTVTYCEFDLAAGTPNTAVIWARGGGTLVVEYNWCPNSTAPTPFFLVGDKAGDVTVRYNAAELSPFVITQAASGFTLVPLIAFNTVWCSQVFSSGPAFQIGDTLVIDSPSFANNTLIANAVSVNISFWFGIASFDTGEGLIYDNWCDPTSTFGVFYGAPSLFTDEGWLLVNNIDLVTGDPIT